MDLRTFPNQAEGLATLDFEIDAVNRLQDLFRLSLEHAVQPGRGNVEISFQLFDLEVERRGPGHCAERFKLLVSASDMGCLRVIEPAERRLHRNE